MAINNSLPLSCKLDLVNEIFQKIFFLPLSKPKKNGHKTFENVKKKNAVHMNYFIDKIILPNARWHLLDAMYIHITFIKAFHKGAILR